ncbi:MAG: triose-phosphate isomerase [Peptococcaceae bacterium]|jgi:triosephosphate isomerase|nr:triose-phosphate isomerase [Peptococcaceae bacterium]MDH7524747.1 triose-phosphate isomerase [Peptococcaceae bacterium]
MRQPIVGANWKMHKTLGEARDFITGLPADPETFRRVEVVIFPPFTALAAVKEALRGTGIKLGAQNMHPAEKGAFTGEVSPLMLLDAGCSHVIVGHSERRRIFGETNEFINEKVKSALAHKLIPLLCIGETLEEKRNGRTEEVCEQQLFESLAGVEGQDVAGMVIAYEPVWAIGTGVNATAGDAEETIGFIRDLLRKRYGNAVAGAVRIQYGGSVKPDNAGDYFQEENIDGALVGGASLEGRSFFEIVRSAAAAG